MEERVKTRTFFVSILFMTIGLYLIYSDTGNERFVNTKNSLGGSIFTAGLFAIMWDYFGKKAVIDEVLAKSRISNDIHLSGIKNIGSTFFDFGEQFKSYIKETNSLDIYFRYGQTWRNTYRSELKILAQKNNSMIRVVMPDPNGVIANELASRMNKTVENVRMKILDTTDFFKEIKTEVPDSDIEIYYCDQSPLFSYYVFDNIALYSLYSHAKQKIDVPTFVCNDEGFLYKFMSADYDTIIKDTTTQKIL